MTISERAYKNIKYLCRKKNVPLASIEQQMCVSAGWMSRAQKLNTIRLRDVEIASLMLDVPITEIISDELVKKERIAEIEHQIRKATKELEALKSDTQ